MHYQRWHRTGDVERPEWAGPTGFPAKICGIDECRRTTKNGGRGWCSVHYARWRRTGDPLGVGNVGQAGDLAGRIRARLQENKEKRLRDEVRRNLPRLVRELTNQGLSAKEIGRRLGVTERTVQRRRQELGITQETWNNRKDIQALESGNGTEDLQAVAG